jgi:hypothetical protein
MRWTVLLTFGPDVAHWFHNIEAETREAAIRVVAPLASDDAVQHRHSAFRNRLVGHGYYPKDAG